MTAPWAQVVRTQIPATPWALVDPRGRVFAFTTDPRMARCMVPVLNRALHISLESDGDTCPILIGCGLTWADGRLTDAGLEWLANTEVPPDQPN